MRCIVEKCTAYGIDHHVHCNRQQILFCTQYHFSPCNLHAQRVEQTQIVFVKFILVDIKKHARAIAAVFRTLLLSSRIF